MIVRGLIFLAGLSVATLFFTVNPKDKQGADKQKFEMKQEIGWKEAWELARAGKRVRLTVHDVWSQNSDDIVVHLKDETKSYELGAVAFYAKNPMSCVFDLGGYLRNLDAAPDEKTKVVVEGDKGQKVTWEKVEIVVQKERR